MSKEKNKAPEQPKSVSTSYPKKYVIESPKLTNLITEKNTLLEQGRDLTKQIDKLDQERSVLGHKIQKLKDKIIPLAQELGKPFLHDEFEDFGTIDIENGSPIIEVFSHLETWKEGFRKNKSNNS